MNMMQEQAEDIVVDELTGALMPDHPFSSVQKVERIGPGLLKLWFRNVGDAVAFKLRWAT